MGPLGYKVVMFSHGHDVYLIIIVATLPRNGYNSSENEGKELVIAIISKATVL